MNEISGNASGPGQISGSGLQRFLPEPKSSLAASFKGILSSVTGLLSGASSGLAGVDPSYIALLNKQIETQQQMQLVSMESNVEKSRHETQMAPIRNIRVG